MATTINLGKVVPQKGVDYYTEEEAQAFKEEITEELQDQITTNAGDITNLEAVTGTGTDTFSTESAYAVGDVVVYDNKVYRCITAITTAGEWNSTKWEELSVRQELDEKEERIQELEESNKLIISNYNTGVATGDDLDITDALNGYNQGIAVCGNTTQDTSKRTYVCAGTESGDYYFTYDSVNYQFAMPTVSAGDVLVFDTSTLKLYLGETEIITTTDNTGTLITLSTTPNPNFAVDIVDVTGTQEVVVSNKNFFDLSRQDGLALDENGMVTTTKLETAATAATYHLKPNTTYRISLLQADKKTYLANSSISFTVNGTWQQLNTGRKNFITNDTGITTIRTGTSTYSAIGKSHAYIMIEEGETTSEYIDHKGLSTTLHLGDIHLRSIPNTEYRDRIYHENGKWWLEQNISEGTITILDLYSTSNLKLFWFAKPTNSKDYNNQNAANLVLEKTTTDQSSFPHVRGGSNKTKYGIAYPSSTEKTVEDVAEEFDNSKYIYILSTSVVTEITDQTLITELNALLPMQTYREHTIITVSPATGNTGNPAQLEVTYLKDDKVSKEDFELLKARVDLLEE